MLKRFYKNNNVLYIVGLAILGLAIRFYFAPQFIQTSGDLRLYADWGQKLVTYKPLNFYEYPVWLYAPPNYPPLLSLIYGGAYLIYEKHYLLAQLHNLTRIPPAFFIRFFYTYGYYVLLKLPGILADLGIGLLIYKFVLEISKKRMAALFGYAFYIINPVAIFLSSVWGQTDSLIAFFGLLSFYYLYRGNFAASLPLLFTSFYIKPNWGVFIPLYIFLLFSSRFKMKQLIIGSFISLTIFFLATAPFSRNIIEFTYWMMSQRILPTATVAHKASISAFNLYTLFFKMDFDPDSLKLLGILPLNIFGYICFISVNLVTFVYLSRSKMKLENIMLSLFAIGFGGYLFLTNMLERYFFAAFAPMVVLMITKPKLLVKGILINVAVFSNLTYAFFRRTKDSLADSFSANNFLLVRLFSAVSVISWFLVVKDYFLLKFKRG